MASMYPVHWQHTARCGTQGALGRYRVLRAKEYLFCPISVLLVLVVPCSHSIYDPARRRPPLPVSLPLPRASHSLSPSPPTTRPVVGSALLYSVPLHSLTMLACYLL